VLDFLKEKPQELNTDDNIYAWHINYMIILRRKFFVLMNDLTRYSVVLYGLKKSDFEDPILFLQEAIMITMHFDGFAQELVLKYVNGISEVTYGKTKNRKLVSQLNRAMQDADWYAHDCLYDQIFQPEISQHLNNGYVGTNNWKEVHCPKDKMLKYLEML
jgi:hypothetical protein